jgi:hypothetical protein
MLDRLEAVDLALRLAVAPWQFDDIPNGIKVREQDASKMISFASGSPTPYPTTTQSEEDPD